jgi:5-methylcytosine-specific restriction endonuclease McrA
MIPVRPAPEPGDFDARVRQPGLRAIAELVGERVEPPRRGRKRVPKAARREDIPPEKFPTLWRYVLPDMLTAYNRICAYLGLYISRATGAPSVDHVVPKSREWDKVYEWSNYRLAAARINAHKSDLELLLDPFEIPDGLFALEFVGFQVVAGPAVGDLENEVTNTITVLGLNRPDCCAAREEWARWYDDREISIVNLERCAPFVAREMRRQHRLRPEDG